MKKLLVLILCVVAAFAAVFALTACEAKVDKDGNVTITDGGDNGGSSGGSQGGNETGDSGSGESGGLTKTEINSKKLTVNDDVLYGKFDNSITTFSFINDIEVADGATYTVCTDLACTNVVLSKTISLAEGDNVCYILVTNGNDMVLYTATIRRKPIYTVEFEGDSYGAALQNIEEDGFATVPKYEPLKSGYNFDEWNYDFTAPIVKNTIIYAKWQAIKYKITYELNGGENSKTNPEYYTIEDEVTLAAPTKSGYTFTGWSNDGKIEKGSTGDKTFTVNYSADVKLSQNGKIVTGLNNNVSDLVILPEYDGIKVTSIGDRAFYGRSSLTSVTISAGVTSIGYMAFYDCSSLTSVYYTGTASQWATIDGLETNMSSGRTLYINNKEVTEVTLEGITEIKPYAFRYCSSLTSVTIGSGVTSIGNYVFYGCTSLTSVTIGNGVTSIDDWAFSGCTSLTSVTIGNGVTRIGRSAFEGCSSLTSITIPDSVTSIDGYAFRGCSSLTSIVIPDGVTRIGRSAFEGCSSLTSITLPFVGVTVNGTENTHFGYIFGASSYSDNSKYISGSLRTVIISDGSGVTSIGNYAFYGCTSLTSIIIPDSVTSIGDEAFSGCSSLTSITIGSKVTNIGWCAFQDCLALKSITVDENNKNYKSIDGNLYSKDGKTLIQYALGKTDASFIIPNGVTRIEDCAFSCSYPDISLSLALVIIPDSITYIGWDAFGNIIFCNGNAKVFYKGNKAEWEKIKVETNTWSETKTLYYYSETKPTESGNYWHYGADGVTPVIWKND